MKERTPRHHLGKGLVARALSSRLRGGERGIAAVEFALLAPIMILLLVGVTEMSLILLADHLLENATYNASRLAKTGFIESGKTQMETVMDELLGRLGGLSPLLNPARLSVSSTVYGDLSDIGQPGEGSTGLGTASQVVVYVISYPWQTFTPLIGDLVGNEDGVITLTARIVVRNEPYE